MKLTVAFTALLVVATSNALAQAERNRDRQMAEAFYAKADRLFSSGNLAAWYDIFSPDVYFADTQGKRMDLSQFKQMIASMGWKYVQVTTTVRNVQLQNQEMAVWVERKMNYRVHLNSSWVPMTQTARYAETLVQSGAGWKITSCQQLVTDEPWTFKTGGG